MDFQFLNILLLIKESTLYSGLYEFVFTVLGPCIKAVN